MILENQKAIFEIQSSQESFGVLRITLKVTIYLCTLNLYCTNTNSFVLLQYTVSILIIKEIKVSIFVCQVFSLICLQHSGHTFKPLDEVYDQHVSSITDEVLINLLH